MSSKKRYIVLWHILFFDGPISCVCKSTDGDKGLFWLQATSTSTSDRTFDVYQLDEKETLEVKKDQKKFRKEIGTFRDHGTPKSPSISGGVLAGKVWKGYTPKLEKPMDKVKSIEIENYMR